MAICKLPTGTVTWKDMAGVVDAATAIRRMRRAALVWAPITILIRMTPLDGAVPALRTAIQRTQADAVAVAAP
jgi:hypothetical protein